MMEKYQRKKNKKTGNKTVYRGLKAGQWYQISVSEYGKVTYMVDGKHTERLPEHVDIITKYSSDKSDLKLVYQTQVNPPQTEGPAKPINGVQPKPKVALESLDVRKIDWSST